MVNTNKSRGTENGSAFMVECNSKHGIEENPLFQNSIIA